MNSIHKLTNKKYGLIAGNGNFPFLVLENACLQNIDIVVIAIKGETSEKINNYAETIEWVNIGQLGKLIRFFKNQCVTHAIMAGQIKHKQILGSALPDLKMAVMLAKLVTKNTSSLLEAVTNEIESEGIQLVDSTIFLKHLLPNPGVLTPRIPNKRETADINYGLTIAREIARLDLGQTIVVSNCAVVAIEAMEGTDATILRAGEIANRKNLTVIKVARPNQDMRFDVPVVGKSTLEIMKKAGVTALSITAHKTLLLDKEEMLEFAKKNKITVVAS